MENESEIQIIGFTVRFRFRTELGSIVHQVLKKDMIEAVNKVIKGYAKFSATSTYMVYN